MQSCGNGSACVVRFIRKLRGTSEPILVQADDRLLYVVKFLDNPQGPNTLFNESAGSELFRAVGLSTPAWKPLLVTDLFLDRNRGSWLGIGDAAVRPRAGLCFGSLYLGADAMPLFEILPRTWFRHIANRTSFWMARVLDACAHHLDRRQAVFAEESEGQLRAYFIDHGHLFGGPHGSECSPGTSFRYLDARIYPDLDGKERQPFLKTMQSVDPEQLRRRARALPEEWKTASALKNFNKCLDHLANSTRLTNLLNETISLACPSSRHWN
ncbi:MAG TPA: hypothetical protein VMU71_04150 [Terracidiphilus sp.]|nr:hypothetical protein [Terracidiphilus sp.]